MQGLLCSSMEAVLEREASSFAGLDAKLDGVACTRQGDSDVVACTGKIVATYGTEQTEFPLVSYRVRTGRWRMEVVRGSRIPMRRHLLTRENAYALALCLILILLIIVTSDTSPQWIYQGF